MMAGDALPECEVCNHKLLNTDVYRDYFWHLFQHHYDRVWATTDDTGHTTMLPVSWDYRFSNLCNYKCRHCGDMLSSAWESEQRQYHMVDWSNPKNNWMQPEVRSKISQFQDTQVEAEFAQAVEEHRVEEIYWVGGEPLMYEQHWRYMRRIIELGDGKNVYARYNTNLSRVDWRGWNLYKDILLGLRDWQICASLDGTGEIGEYIRTGLDYQQWRQNFRQGVDLQTHRRQMRIDFTLTLPGLFEVINIQNLAREFDVDVLAKLIFSFSPNIVMSPLALPREILDRIIDDLDQRLDTGALRDVVLQMRQRPTFQEQWPDTYREALLQGKNRMLGYERIRDNPITLDAIFSRDPEIKEWWDDIR
jgi:hypothetical protein